MKSFAPDKAARLLVGRSLLAPLVSLRWRRFIREFHRRVGASEPVVRVLLKPLRNYIHRGYWPRRRLTLLLQHYAWFAATFSPEFSQKFCSNENMLVSEFEGRKGTRYGLYLVASVVAILQREGEIALYLAKSPDAPKLCRLAFAFTRTDDRPALVIGGIQGPLAAHKREVIDATRDLNGLRPKDAVLLAARAFAQALSIERVLAVSDANHVLNRLQDKTKFSSYDAYWRERGGVEAGPFGFAFGPLDPIGPALDRRDERKLAILEAVGAFVRAHRRGESRGPVANAELQMPRPRNASRISSSAAGSSIVAGVAQES